MKKHHPETNCVHSHQEIIKTNGVNTPIEVSSAFQYLDTDENTYPRYFNTPNQKVIVEQISRLEGSETGMLFSSGMAAISTTLLTFLQEGDHVIFSGQLYGGTFNLTQKEFPKRGINCTFVPEAEIQAYRDAIQENTKVIYFETPSNPMLSILDIEAIAQLAKDKGIISMIDNTFASPINQNPIHWGVDIVLHSGTKYLGGHSDLCFGAMLSSQKLIDQIYQSAINYGGSLNALDLYLIERSLKTLAVRVKAQNTNALKIAQWLQKHEDIKNVFYPGLETHPRHEIAKKQSASGGFGGMLAFELEVDDIEVVNQFLLNLNVITPALSLGGVESTITVSAQTSHSKMPKTEREKLGISDSLMRLSVGIEHADDLIQDLEVALEKLKVLA